MLQSVSDEFSSDGWEEDVWEDYVTLPTGYQLVENVQDRADDRKKYLFDHFGRQKYPDGLSKFKISLSKERWIITRMLRWKDICVFPKGHELRGVVQEGQEMKILHERYKEKYEVECLSPRKFYVKQVCACGKKKECDIHIFPSQVKLEFSRSLAIVTPPERVSGKNVEKKLTPIEPIFRRNHAMTHAEAKTFFDKFEINWKFFITAVKITFWMICKCGEAFEATPCDKCYKKRHSNCHICGKIRRKRMLKKCHTLKKCLKCEGICSDCKAAEISFCEHCKKDVRLDHECVSLIDQHWGLRKNTTYPRFVRQNHSKLGYCIDCKAVMHENAYPRHQYRRHNDRSSCDLYDRDYRTFFCDYCFYYDYDTTKITNHMKMHSLKKTHVCKSGCGAAFTHAAQEIMHRRKNHKYTPQKIKHHRRVGKKIVLMNTSNPKRQKISDPAP